MMVVQVVWDFLGRKWKSLEYKEVKKDNKMKDNLKLIEENLEKLKNYDGWVDHPVDILAECIALIKEELKKIRSNTTFMDYSNE